METRLKFLPLPVVLFLAVLAAAGCGSPSVRVSGRVTCHNKPVAGIILFSPKETEGNNAARSESAALTENGMYEIHLKYPGKYLVVVTPTNVNPRPKPGEFDYPCDRTPVERDLVAGDNEVSLELPKRTQ